MPVTYSKRKYDQTYAIQPSSGWLERNYAAYLNESSIAAGIEGLSNPMPDLTDAEKRAYIDFDSSQHIPERFQGTPYERKFAGLKTPTQIEFRANQLDKELEMYEQMGEGFWATLPGTIAGATVGSVSTPLDLIAGYKIAKAGGKVAHQALKAAGLTGSMVGLDEAILQPNRQLRSGFETAMNVGGGALFGGLLVGAFTPRPVTRLVDADQELTPTSPSGFVHQNKDTGAAEVVYDITPERINEIEALNVPEYEKTLMIMEEQGLQYEVVGKSAVSLAGGHLLKYFAPDLYMSLSESSVMRRLGGKFATLPLAVRKNLLQEGDVSVVSQAARYDDIIDSNLDSIFHTAHKNYSAANGKIQRYQTDMMVQRAIADGGFTGDDVIDKAASDFMKFYDEYARRFVKVGILTDGGDGLPVKPLGDERWFPRTWSTDYALRTRVDDYADELTDLHIRQLREYAEAEKMRLEAGKREWEEQILPAAQKKQKELLAKGDVPEIKRLEKQLKQLQDTLKKTKSKNIGQQTKKAITQVEKQLEDERAVGLRNVLRKKEYQSWLRKERTKFAGENKWQKKLDAALKNPDSVKSFYIGMHERVRRGDGFELDGKQMDIGFDGVLNMTSGKRTVDIATSKIPDKFLEGDGMLSASRVIKRLNRQALMLENAEMRDDHFGWWLKELDLENKAKIERLKADKKMTAKQKLTEERRLTDLYKTNKERINKLLRDYYHVQLPVQSNGFRNVAQTLKMLSVLTKLGSVMASTLGETMAGLNTYGVNGYLRHVTAWLSNPATMAKMPKAIRHDYAVGLQTSMVTRLGEMGEYHSGMGNKMRMAHKFTDFTLDKLYGLGIWTRQISMQAAFMGQSKLGRLAVKKKLTKKDIIDLGRLGVDEDMMRQIKKEAGNFKKIGLSYDMNVSKWSDQELANKVEDIIFAEVENTIIKPRTGATPFWGKTVTGSLMLQFKHFIIASTTKYWLNDMQRVFGMGDIRGLERQMALMGMGYLMWKIRRDWLYEKQPADEPAYDTITAAMSFGGGLGLAMEFYNALDEMWTDRPNTRYRGARTVHGTILGPSASLGYDILKSAEVVGPLARGEEIPNDVWKSLNRVSPGGNSIPYRLGKRIMSDDR